jgi:hypothetical protein
VRSGAGAELEAQDRRQDVCRHGTAGGKLRAAEAAFNTKLRGIAAALHAFAEIADTTQKFAA